MAPNQTGGRLSPGDCAFEIDLEGQTEIVSLKTEVTVLGSGTGCAIRVPGVAERQAEVRVTESGARLINVGDPQALSVNGRAVLTDVDLRSGDRLRCGEFHLRFRCPEPSGGAAEESGESSSRGGERGAAGSSAGPASLGIDEGLKPFPAQVILELELLPRRKLQEILKSTRREQWDGIRLSDEVLKAYGWGAERVGALTRKSIRRMGRVLAESVERKSLGYRLKMSLARSLGRVIFLGVVVVLVLGMLLFLEYTTGWNLYEQFARLLPSRG